MRESHTLRLVLHRLSVNDRGLELLNNASVDCVTLVGEVSVVVIAQTSNLRRVDLRSLRLYTLLNGAQQARNSPASCPSASCRLGRVSVYPTCSTGFISRMSRKLYSRMRGKTHIASINSSTFHPCSELMGTAFGIRYRRSSSSMLIESILFRT